jgi:hypothetical protein
LSEQNIDEETTLLGQVIVIPSRQTWDDVFQSIMEALTIMDEIEWKLSRWYSDQRLDRIVSILFFF